MTWPGPFLIGVRKINGIRGDRGRYERYLKKGLGEKRLHEITAGDLEEIQSNMRKKGLSPATIRHPLTVVRSIFSGAILPEKFKGTAPTKMGKFPSSNNRRERFLTQEEAQRLMDALRQESRTTYEIALISLLTGLRTGEIHNLRGKGISISQTDSFILRIPKISKSSRKAVMPEEVAEVLKSRVVDQTSLYLPPGSTTFPT
jgi:integrase